MTAHKQGVGGGAVAASGRLVGGTAKCTQSGATFRPTRKDGPRSASPVVYPARSRAWNCRARLWKRLSRRAKSRGASGRERPEDRFIFNLSLVYSYTRKKRSKTTTQNHKTTKLTSFFIFVMVSKLQYSTVPEPGPPRARCRCRYGIIIL
jgi:hypothetical protein